MTYELRRSPRLTTVFGHPGSTEQPFLQESPDDFTYVLALQEASVIADAGPADRGGFEPRGPVIRAFGLR